MNRVLIAIAAFVLWSAAAFGAGWAWRGDRSERDGATQTATAATGAAQAQATARTTEHQQGQAVQVAADKADTRQEQIDADYETRLAAALAGRDSELGRLRKQWAGCETDRLSGGAGAAAAADEEDRLRRAGTARVLRATELAQSERDEAVDRYEAIRTAGVRQ